MLQKGMSNNNSDWNRLDMNIEAARKKKSEWKKLISSSVRVLSTLIWIICYPNTSQTTLSRFVAWPLQFVSKYLEVIVYICMGPNGGETTHENGGRGNKVLIWCEKWKSVMSTHPWLPVCSQHSQRLASFLPCYPPSAGNHAIYSNSFF